MRTQPASFNWVYADLMSVHPTKLRLLNARMQQELPLQYVKALRLVNGNVIERQARLESYQHNNAEMYPIALVGGNMLDADNGIFCLAYFGVSTGKFVGAGYRYRFFKGLAAAEAAAEKWAKRKFHVPA